MAYPATIPTLTTVLDVDANNDGGTDINATLLNSYRTNITAIQTELGVDPAGGSATVVARLDAMDTTGATYLLLDGTRAMTGDLDMNTNAVQLEESAAPTNVANNGFLYVKDDGGDTELYYMDDGGVEAQLTENGALILHAALHERAGTDQVDGDHLDIDMTPTAYVPATTPAEAADVDDLAAHLYGIDVALSKFKTGNIWIPTRAWHPSSTLGCAAGLKTEYGTQDVDLYQMAFDTTADEHAQTTLAMPADWGAGTITAVPYWTTATGDGGAAETVCWAVQGRAYANDDPIDAAWGTAQTSTDTWIADLDVHMGPATAAITLAGTPAALQLVQLRLFRDVSGDDLAADAQFLGLMVTYTRALS